MRLHFVKIGSKWRILFFSVRSFLVYLIFSESKFNKNRDENQCFQIGSSRVQVDCTHLHMMENSGGNNSIINRMFPTSVSDFIEANLNYRDRRFCSILLQPLIRFPLSFCSARCRIEQLIQHAVASPHWMPIWMLRFLIISLESWIDVLFSMHHTWSPVSTWKITFYFFP